MITSDLLEKPEDLRDTTIELLGTGLISYKATERKFRSTFVEIGQQCGEDAIPPLIYAVSNRQALLFYFGSSVKSPLALRRKVNYHFDEHLKILIRAARGCQEQV
ncbi:hypothetical protein K7W42_22000 [Deinococcus sp. HMF7604]|uniref:hypothetical protein n=1 Tax=Deinococcus betulae TaxID=2873312 RepID=UPI001CCE74E9|nr:hypothetical protein [Deinococcus betulae]MBZ9753508.1 hypothetical protein [Deinococcus betulae]